MCKFKAQKYFHWFEMWNGSFLFGWISDIFSGCFSVSMWMCLTLFYNVGTWSSIATILLWKNKQEVAVCSLGNLTSEQLGTSRLCSVCFHPALHRNRARWKPDPAAFGCRTDCTERTGIQRGAGSREHRDPERSGIQNRPGSRADRGPAVLCSGVSELRLRTDTERSVAAEPGCGILLAAAAPPASRWSVEDWVRDMYQVQVSSTSDPLLIHLSPAGPWGWTTLTTFLWRICCFQMESK